MWVDEGRRKKAEEISFATPFLKRLAGLGATGKCSASSELRKHLLSRRLILRLYLVRGRSHHAGT